MDRQALTAQVKFIWTPYRPSEEQFDHLAFLQAEIRNFYWLAWERTGNDYDFAVELQSMHSALRDTLHIVKS